MIWNDFPNYGHIRINFIFYFSLVSNVYILDCEISLHGDSSILLYGTDSIISGISVRDNGCGGIHMSGGDQVCYTYIFHTYCVI